MIRLRKGPVKLFTESFRSGTIAIHTYDGSPADWFALECAGLVRKILGLHRYNYELTQEGEEHLATIEGNRKQ